MLSLNRYLKTSKLLLVVCLFLFKNNTSQNLINNGSFENISPPNNWNNWGGEFITASQNPIQRVLLDWDEFNSADLLTSSCTHTWSGIPVNKFGYIQPKEGNNVVGIQVYPNVPSYESKEYIYQQLITPLQAGKIYCLSFFLSKSDRKEYAIKNIGAYFSNSQLAPNGNGYISKVPQVVNQSGFITDTIGWTQIQGCFTAIGGEQFITIGNFNSNANTDTFYTGTNNPIPSDPQYAYYYIDDITLIDQTTVGINELSNGNSVSVYPNPANDIVNFQFSDTNTKRKIELYNTIGELVSTENATTQNSSLKTDHLQIGIYFYNILVNDKIIKTDKIVIIK